MKCLTPELIRAAQTSKQEPDFSVKKEGDSLEVETPSNLEHNS